MTPEESKVLKDHLKAAAAILLNNTPKEELQSFNSIELAVRDSNSHYESFVLIWRQLLRIAAIAIFEKPMPSFKI